jgi:serine/threonine protein kinase
MLPCPNDDELLGFVEGRLPVVRAREVAAHADDCVVCTNVLAVPRDITPKTLGRYVLSRCLGAGGMGLVHLAYDPELDRKVALKLLHPDANADDDLAERLRREARALAQLSHPNVVTVYEVGKVADQVYVAMEFVDGITLGEWMKQPHSEHEILRTMLQAGRGLAAAHSVGLTHRDLKPANVLISADGRVRVADFGLAVRAQANEIAGTPAYMAPEQSSGSADPRSDQYAFCLILREAFGGKVPHWLRKILARGLSPSADARFRSMDELMDVIRSGMVRRRVRNRLALAGLVLAGLAFPAAHWLSRSPCQGGGELDGVWDAPRRQALARAFLAVERPYSAESLRGASQALDAYARSWQNARHDACEATWVKHEQSEELLDRRMMCLSQRREDLRAVVDTLLQSTPRVVGKAQDVVADLPAIAACSDSRELLAPARFSKDPRVRAAEDALRPNLARARALLFTSGSDGTAAREAAGQLVRATEPIDDLPFRAEALELLGFAQAGQYDFEGAQATLEQAWWAAAAGGHDRVVASSATELVYVFTVGHAQIAEGSKWARVASAAVRRLDGDPELDGQLERVLGYLATGRGQLEEALSHDRRAVTLLERAHGEQSWRVANALVDLGEDYYDLQRWDEALATYERAIGLFKALAGDRHPAIAPSLARIGDIHGRRGETVRSLAECERAWLLLDRDADEYRKDAGDILYFLAEALARNHRVGEAIARSEQAAKIRRGIFGPTHPFVLASQRQQARLHEALSY